MLVVHRCSFWAFLQLALLVMGALFSMGAAQPSVPQRTHTFNSYQQTPVMRELLPVFVGTVKVFQGTYADDDIVSLANGTPLDCAPYNADGSTSCRLSETWSKPRRSPDSQFTRVTPSSGCAPFAMKFESNQLRLMVSTQCLGQVLYQNFGQRRRELVGAHGNRTNYAEKAAKKWAKKNDALMDPSMGLYYDPCSPDGLTPYWPGLTAAEIRREEKQAHKARIRFAQLERKKQQDFARYDRWVQRQLRIKKGGNTTLTPEQLDYYYNNPDPFTNKHYPWRWVFDQSGVYVPPSPGSVSGMAVQSMGDNVAKALNEVITSFIFDYAIIFSTPGGPVRIDLTIIPKVFRNANVDRASAFLCRPDGQSAQFPISPAVSDYIPRLGSCATGGRAVPYAFIDSTYTGAHPEEAAWLQGRLAVTGPKVQTFVQNRNSSWVLNDDQAKLKIAVVHSGGGKRAMLQSLGVVQGLTDIGIFEHASWNAGASGGGWYVLAHTLASLNNMQGMNSAESVFQDIKQRINSSLYGDFFEANEVFTDAGLVTTTPMVYDSRSGSPQTSQILCESELKLQSPLIPSGRSANPLDYWARAMTAQDVPSSQLGNRGLDITLSSLVNSPHLSNHAGPLPMLQIHEFANSNNQGPFRLWTASPFDVSLMNGNSHASFPTAILGSDSTSTGDTCTVNLDNAGYLQGISSWAMGTFRSLSLLPDVFVEAICGNNIDVTACQGTAIHNPFRGFEAVDPIAPGLSTQNEIYVSDGGTVANMPVWPFLTDTREADIIFAVDSGGVTSSTTASTVGPTLSTDTTPTNPGSCPSDLNQQICQVNSNSNSPTSSFFRNSCCDMCISGYSLALGCHSSNAPATSNLRDSLTKYEKQMPNNKAPFVPTSDKGIFSTYGMGQRVYIFGCNNVSMSTPIINFPNRIVNSGHSGHYTLKGAVNMRYSPFLGVGDNEEQQYTPAAVQAFWENAKAGLPNRDQSTDGSFAYCIACLYYARATKLNNFIETSCPKCWTNYCFESQL